MTICRQLNDTRGIIASLAALAGAAAAWGESTTASRLFGATEAALRSTRFHLYAVDHREYERNMAAAHSRLSEGAWAIALPAGAAMSLTEAAEAALQLAQR
jgi:hypothetical protein